MDATASDESQPPDHEENAHSNSSQNPKRFRFENAGSFNDDSVITKQLVEVSKTSDVWNHLKVYEDNKGQAVCNYCEDGSSLLRPKRVSGREK